MSRWSSDYVLALNIDNFDYSINPANFIITSAFCYFTCFLSQPFLGTRQDSLVTVFWYKRKLYWLWIPDKPNMFCEDLVKRLSIIPGMESQSNIFGIVGRMLSNKSGYMDLNSIVCSKLYFEFLSLNFFCGIFRKCLCMFFCFCFLSI